MQKENIHRETSSQKGEYDWAKKIAGLSSVKKILTQYVINPIHENRIVQNSQNGILIYGPAGMGKTRIIDELERGIPNNLFRIHASNVVSKSQTQLKELLSQIIQKQKQLDETIAIFIDQIDVLCWEKSLHLYEQILLEILQSIILENKSKIIIIAVTNAPNKISKQVFSIFKCFAYCQMLSQQNRLEILESALDSVKHQISKQSLIQASRKTQYFTGSDLIVLAKDALMEPVRKISKQLKFNQLGQLIDTSTIQLLKPTDQDLQRCLKRIKPSYSKQQLESFEIKQNNLN